MAKKTEIIETEGFTKAEMIETANADFDGLLSDAVGSSSEFYGMLEDTYGEDVAYEISSIIEEKIQLKFTSIVRSALKGR